MFENIIGNNKVKKILSDIQKPSHAYMFLGIEGIGKFLFAKEFANKWLCESELAPCGKCKSCIQFNGNNNMDLDIIEPNDGSIKVEQIRNMIKKVYEKPVVSSKKIYIINDADKMTVSAQNALLKVLEEPPVYIMIILIGSNEHLFLNTIKSRCVKIVFNELEKEELEDYFASNGIQIDGKFLELYEGSIGKAKKLEGLENNYLDLQELILNIEKTKKLDFIKKFTSIITKENVERMLDYLNIILFKFGKKNRVFLNAIEQVNIAIKQYRFNCNVEMLVDNLALNIYENVVFS